MAALPTQPEQQQPLRPDQLTHDKRRRPHLFRIILSCSRKADSEAVYRQTTEEFTRCLENAFTHFGGGLACTAVFGIFLPTAWMAAIHQWLGLGKFPDAPLTQYLTRSVSAFYAVFGGLTTLASLDVRRFGPLITYLAIATMAFGVVITGVDVLAKMPTYWTLGERPPTFVIGLVILLLNRRVQRNSENVAAQP